MAFGSEITRYKIEKIPTDKEILPGIVSMFDNLSITFTFLYISRSSVYLTLPCVSLGLKLSDDTHAVQISQNNEHQLAKV